MKTRDIANFLGGQLSGDGEVVINGVAKLESASDGELAFVENADRMAKTKASCLIVPVDFDETVECPTIRVADPKFAFASIAEVLHPPKERGGAVHPSAVIAGSAKLEPGVFIGAFVCVGENSTVSDGTQILDGAKVGENVTIGRDCVLFPNVVVEDGCIIGDRVILHSGAVIGADGFGFVRGPEGYVKFPQIGTVVLEDDVEIGANTCVDRGSLGETRIGAGTKIDNLVQVAHNVQIGKRVVIAAQVGISGSSVIEDDCLLAGQVGIADHVRLMRGVAIGGQSGVLPGKIVRSGVWMGTPVQPLDEYKRQTVMVKRIERLREELKELKRRVMDK